MKPMIIDAATIFDPARLIAVLASVDIRHSEIWVSQRYDHFKEKDFITGWGTDSKFALLPDERGRYKADPLEMPKPNEMLDPKSYMTGPKILRWALSKGIAVPKDLYKYESTAKDLENINSIHKLSEAIMLGPPHNYDLRAGKERTEEHLRHTGRNTVGPEYAWRLEPYGIGCGLGLILAAAEYDNVEPFVSHPYFRDKNSVRNYTFYSRETEIALAIGDHTARSSISIEESLSQSKRLLSSPESINISDVAFYLDQRDRINHITGIISASKDLETRNKDVGIITSKALGTYAVDTAFFGGLPIASGLVSLYDVGSRFLKSRK